jgi:hypothetical protein
VPQQELDLLQIPAVFAAQFRAGAAQVVGAEAFDPDLLDDCSTTDHTAQSLRVSPLTFPLFEIE